MYTPTCTHPQITDVGPLNSGQSTITFYIVDVAAVQPVSATMVVQAFQTANPQQLDTYPVSYQDIHLCG